MHKKLLILCSFVSYLIGGGESSQEEVNLISRSSQPSFYEWYTKIRGTFTRPGYPYNREANKTFFAYYPEKFSALNVNDLNQTVMQFIALMQKQYTDATNKELWTHNPPSATDVFITEIEAPLHPIKPFVQKLSVNPKATVVFRGDLHGDIHSLLEFLHDLNKQGYLNGFSIAPSLKETDSFYLVFLGDYTDRGWYGCEVIYTLLQLKLHNPDHVILVRGNHEDQELCKAYGFEAEYYHKYNASLSRLSEPLFRSFKRIMRIYDFLPIALYLQCSGNALQCCHGGLEPGFNPQKLLDAPARTYYQWFAPQTPQTRMDTLNLNSEIIEKHSDHLICKLEQTIDPWDYHKIGFMWNDFKVHPQEKSSYEIGRGYEYGHQATQHILTKSSTSTTTVQGVFRAHQHSTDRSYNMMRSLLDESRIYGHQGLSKLWNTQGHHHQDTPLWSGIICTHCVSPDTVYGKEASFNYDTYTLLTTAADYNDWHLDVKRITIVPSHLSPGDAGE